jgi:alkanesulfonate monooxygenase SsuD/methylene tetrahydromethanopterin reductase-like flavin-dependent oxidoreductase (luciferase family)
MRFGSYFFLQAPPGRAAATIIPEELEQMVLSEALGFDSVWLTEHHYSDYGLSSAPSVLLATLAARTERIQLGMAVYVMPFHHPLRLAEETATLDILSGGRLVVGLGRGNRPIEFVGHGVRQEQSRSRLEEGLEILRQAWTQERVRFHGAHWTIDDIPVQPKPLSKPHPPLALAVMSPPSVGWAAELGLPILTSGLFTPVPQTVALRERYVQGLVASGRSAAEIAELLARWVVTKHVYVAPTDAEAQADAEPAERWYLDAYARSISAAALAGVDPSVALEAEATVGHIRQLTWEGLLRDCLLIGSPQTVIPKVLELQSAGIGELVCWMNFGGLPPDRAQRSMRLFAQEIMPAIRASANRPAPTVMATP